MANPVGTQFTVISVGEYTLGNGVECWKVMLVNERNLKFPHFFPKFTLEQRAAEYDLDPTDITGLIDLILHEVHIPNPQDAFNFATDAAAKIGLTAASPRSIAEVKKGQQVPVTLHTAADRATAKKAHLARLDEVKSRITIKSGKGKGLLSKGDTTDPLQKIVDNHGVDPERVKLRAAYVDELMAGIQGKLQGKAMMRLQEPGGMPMRSPQGQRAETPYDSSVRRRGVTVALLDT